MKAFSLILLTAALMPHLAFSAYELKRQRIFPTLNKKICQSDLKLAMFDADSTLRVAPSGSVSANSPIDVKTLPVEERIAELNQKGFVVAIFSNQGGIGGGFLGGPNLTYRQRLEIADQALVYTVARIRKKNEKARVHYIDYADAKSKWRDNSEQPQNEDIPPNVTYRDRSGKNHLVRKPGIGMGVRLVEELQKWCDNPNLKVDMKRSFMVGDSAYKTKKEKETGIFEKDVESNYHFSNSDRGFAANFFGVDMPTKTGNFFEPYVFFQWNPKKIQNFRGLPVFDSSNLLQIWEKEAWRAWATPSEAKKGK